MQRDNVQHRTDDPRRTHGVATQRRMDPPERQWPVNVERDEERWADDGAPPTDGAAKDGRDGPHRTRR